MADGADSRVCLGAIAGAHGVRGDVRIKTFTQDPLAIADYGPLSTEDGGRQFKIARAREAKGVVVATIDGIRNREAALALRGTRLYVDRDRLPEDDEEDSWYHADLIGLEVRGEDGALLGTLTGIHDFGAGDLLDIKLAGSGKSVIVPFTGEAVPKVDVAAGVITVIPPEGLLDEDEDEAPD